MKLPKPKLVMMEWIDSCSPCDSGAEFTADEVRAWEPLKMISIGILLGSNNSGTAYLVAANYSEENSLRQITLVPKVNVKRITRLKY